MSNVENNPKTSDDQDAGLELFCAWSEDRESPTPKPLSAWREARPEYAADFLDWAAESVLLDWAEQRPVRPEDEEAARKAGQKVVAELRASYAAETSRPLTSLLGRARALGLNAAALAHQWNLGVSMIAMLNQRLIGLAGLPEALLYAAAETLNVSVAQLRDYFRQPPTLSAAAQYRADAAPQAGAQQAFADALEGCPDMTEEQKAFWRGVLPTE